MSPPPRKLGVSAIIGLAMVLAGLAGLLLPVNDAPLIVGLLVGSIWVAGLVVRTVSGQEAGRTAWILGCVVGVAAATTSMASGFAALVVGIIVSLTITVVGIWTINDRMPPTSANR